MPDYSKQLAEIAKALNRPVTSVWLVATFSTLLGFIGGFIAQWSAMRMTDAYRLNKVRRVLYLDLAEMFWSVRRIQITAITEIPATQKWHWQVDQLRKTLLFRGETYCSDNLEFYIQLPERYVAEFLYLRFHRILDEADSLNVNSALVLTIFAEVVHSGDLSPKYFRRYLGKKRATSLLHTLDAYHRENEEGLKGMDLHASDNA